MAERSFADRFEMEPEFGRRHLFRRLLGGTAIGLSILVLGCQPEPEPVQPLPPDRLPPRPGRN